MTQNRSLPTGDVAGIKNNPNGIHESRDLKALVWAATQKKKSLNHQDWHTVIFFFSPVLSHTGDL